MKPETERSEVDTYGAQRNKYEGTYLCRTKRPERHINHPDRHGQINYCERKEKLWDSQSECLL